MRTTHSFGIDFLIRRCKENKKNALIFARISVDGERRELSIKEQIEAVAWNPKEEKVKGKSIDVRTTNDYIDDVRFKIKEKYRMLEDSGALITAEAVKAAYLGVHALQKGHKLLELLDYFRKIWDDKLSEGSMKNYRTTIDYIKLFVAKQYPSGDIYLPQLNMQVATDFEHYIRNTPIKEHDPCKGNGLAKHLQRFKRIVNWAVEIEWLKIHPFEKYSCRVKKSRRKKLTLEEVIQIECHRFVNEKLGYIRDLFLFSCYTGLAFADVMALSATDLERADDGTIWCKIYRKKSGEFCALPFLKVATSIVNKYWDKGNALCGGPIFPSVSNQETNRCLKSLMEIFGIVLNMTFHLARHTFAKTVALKNGVPLETVQIMMGHTKISTTQIYADVDEEKIMEDMSGMEQELGRKRDRLFASRQLQYTS